MESRGEFIQQRVQALSNRVSTVILISHITVLPGPVPAPNPPTALNPTVGSAVTTGAQSINIQCQTASGRLIAGDQFTIAGIKGTYTVNANNTSSMDLFTGVTFTPGLSANVAAGTAITLNYVNQQKVYAFLSSSTKSIVENGTITVILELLIPALNLTFIPNVGDRVILNGTNYLVGSSVPVYAWGQVASYRLMVK
jgi:hypothetical protein